MPETKTQPLVARHIPDRQEFGAQRDAGTFRITDPDEEREQFFWYHCPCGCGLRASILVGNGFKPADSPSWNWNGSREKPTLQPSIHHRDHWHGWLTDGVWRSC